MGPGRGSLAHFLVTTGEHQGRILAVFPVEEVAHGFAARGVRASVGFQRVRGYLGVCSLSFAAVGTAVGEAGLAGLEFEFLAADYAGFDRIRHISMIQGPGNQGHTDWGAGGRVSQTALKPTHDSLAEIGIVSAIGC